MLEQFQQVAINEFVLKVAVPLLHFKNVAQDGEEATGVGTGTFFERDNRLFLVTARHLFDDFDPDDIALPVQPRGGELRTIGEFTIHKPDDEFLDVAILELRSDDFRETVKANWNVLTLESVVECPSDGEFFLFGFPWAMLKIASGNITGRPTAVHTSRYKGTPTEAKQPVYGNVDLFFAHSETAEDHQGRKYQLP